MKVLVVKCLSVLSALIFSTLSFSKIVEIKDNNLIKLLKEQIHYEYESAYLYEARAQYALNLGLKGTSNWFKKQADEERVHADKVLDHLRSAGITDISLPQLNKIPVKFESISQAFKSALKREEHLSDHIKKIYSAAQKVNNIYTIQLMNWFIKEQIEEETMFSDTIEQINLYIKMNNYPGMDDYLGKRLK